MNKAEQNAIKELVNTFECDGRTDYSRMAIEVKAIIGKTPDNTTVWSLVNRANSAVARVSLSLDFLDD